jgi:tetratricopeptide (TPR) repeat protein/DNA-binding winged helix-turn-helix (wHTH) protein/TolB-like protein
LTAMKVLNPQLYRFAEVVLDPSQNCLTIAGQDCYIRQKLLQLLIYLVEQRHRVVSKSDLTENVWEGAAITDDALVQSIKELRRLLDDDPRQPRFIKTVPKVGYRFIAPVEEVFANDFATLRLEETTSIELEFEEFADEEVGWPAPEVVKPLASPAPGWRLKPAYIFAAVAGLLLAGILVIYLLPGFRQRDQRLTEVTLPQLPGKKTVAVMYFDNQSGNPRLDWLREGLADMLITNLSRSDNLTLLNRRQLHLLLERLDYQKGDDIRLDDAQRIARVSRAEVVALGSFTSVDESVRIDVQMYDTRNNQLLASERLVVDTPKAILTNIDFLSLKLAAHLGASPENQQKGSGLAEVMTNNLEAYRCYSLAVEKAQALHNEEAIALLEKAVKLDPQFAMAHARIGYAYGVTWDLPEKARPYLEKAFQLSQRLTEKDRLFITAWYEIANRNYPAAIETFRKILAQYPLEVEAYGRLALLLQGEDRLEEAVEVVKQGLAIDSEAKDLYNLLGGIYLLLGSHDESIAMRRRYVELAANEPNSYDSLGLSYQWAGRYDEAIQEYHKALRLKPDFEIALIHLANVHFQLGQYRKAVELYRQYIAIAPSGSESARGYTSIVYIYHQKGDLQAAEQLARKFPENTAARIWSALLLALERGELNKAERFQEQYLALSKTHTERGTRVTPRGVYQLRGAFALKRGRAVEAIENFKMAIRHRPLVWHIDALEDCLANAYLELALWDEAIAEYERILRLNPQYPLAHFHLAQAYEGKGEAEKARASYAQFLQIWKQADPDLREVIVSKNRLR